jgi:quinoprotein glucose dehydrogenase
LVEAATGSTVPEVRIAMESLRQAQSERDPVLATWLSALAGGDQEAGEKLFIEKVETSCLRCHSHGSNGASEVGPELTDVGTRLTPRELLLSIIDPNASVAEGYENWMFVLEDETIVVGRIRSEDAGTLVIETPQKEVLELDPAEVVVRKRDLSSMPQDVSSYLSASCAIWWPSWPLRASSPGSEREEGTRLKGGGGPCRHPRGSRSAFGPAP